MIYVLFYIFANAGTIAYLWYNESLNHYLRKIMFTVLLMSLVFSGNIINLYGFQFNVGIVFLINYYLLGFIMITTYGSIKYLEILTKHFITLAIIAFMILPLLLLLNNNMVNENILKQTNLIAAILNERFNYFFILCFVFYVGQVLYTYSFEAVKLRNIYFEFLVRMPLIMSFQSTIFYSMNFLTIHNNNIDVNLFVAGLYNLFVNGISVRYLILLLCVKPYEIIYNIKQKK